MNSIETVSIKIQTGVYGQFRNLNNKVWFALGEYVDNAVQSFEDNKHELRKAQSNYQFEVRIDIDWENDFIKIFDNAGGIDDKNFQRAFEPANIPIDNSGLHEFGMGMKTASIWLADVWAVRTAALKGGEIREVEFDLHKVMAEEREILKVKSFPKPTNLHFTEIILKKLSHNAPSSYQMDKIKKHLVSIYRKFLRSGDMKLYINSDELIYSDPEILVAPPVNKPDAKPILWKKEINFQSGKYNVKGFIGILNTMSTSEHNGLSLFRRGRVIEGSHDEKYRPKIICGQIGSPRFKRVFGELELEGFAVSFNKGSFQEQEDLEALMEAIHVEISSKDFDLYTQAEKFLKPKTESDNIKVAKKIVNSIRKTAKDSNLTSKVTASLQQIDNKTIAATNEELIKTAQIIDSHEEYVEVKDEKYKLKVELITEPTITELYSLSIESDENLLKKIIYKINLAHPFFSRFDKLKNEEDYQPFILIIKSLVLAEIIAPSQGTKNGGNIRINFNHFLRNI